MHFSKGGSVIQPIDMVITWVDGADPIHQAKLADYLRHQGIERPEAAHPTRFNQCGELEHCIYSVLRHAPWIRTIYLVTDSQIPDFLQSQKPELISRVKIIDHRSIFKGYERCLPTFNSISIETMLWRIPELSEQFIYMNDDCILIRPVHASDFFRDHKLIIRGEWKKLTHKKWSYRLKHFFHLRCKSISEHRQVQENSAQLAGFQQHFLTLPHAPFALRKSTFQKFFNQFPEKLRENSCYPLRKSQQFWPISLAYHLELQAHTAFIDNTLHSISVNPAFHSAKKIKKRLIRAVHRKNMPFVCLQSLDEASPSLRAWIFNLIRSL